MTEKKLVHVERIPVRWGDMDAMAHVNNTVYFRYMEQTRISWFEALLPRGEAWARPASSSPTPRAISRRRSTIPPRWK